LLERLRARTGVIVFGIMGGLMAAYLVWLVVRAPQSVRLGVVHGCTRNPDPEDKTGVVG